jgi:hypothetical protein
LHPVSPAFLATVKGSRNYRLKLSVLDGDLQPSGVEVPVAREQGGGVVVDPASIIRRTLSLPLSGIYVPDIAGPIWWGNPLRVEYGIDVARTDYVAFNRALLGLAAHWRFGEAGSTAADQLGVNNGTYSGSPAIVPGLIANDPDTARFFDGVDDEVSVPNHASLNPTAAITLRAVFNAVDFAAATNRRIMEKIGQYALLFEQGANVVTFFLGTVGDHKVGPLPSTGQDHVIHATYDGAFQRLYIDGLELGTGRAVTGAIPTTTNALGIGHKLGSVASDRMKGTIDEPAILSRAMTPAEIAADVAAVRSGGTEWIPVFTGYVDEDEGEVTGDGNQGVVTARDRMKLLDRVLGEPLSFEDGVPVQAAFRRLFEFCGMGTDQALYRLADGDRTLAAAATYEDNVSALEIARAWCDDYALQAYCDPLGVATLIPVPDPAAASAVMSYRRGSEMKLLGFKKRWRDQIRNRAIVNGKGPLGPVRAEARVLNPLSPAYNPVDGSGPLGDRPDVYQSDGITSVEQAQLAADARLPKLALVSEDIELVSAVNPALEGNDVIEIVEPDSDTEGNYLLGRFAVPFDPNATQTGQTQRMESLAAP